MPHSSSTQQFAHVVQAVDQLDPLTHSTLKSRVQAVCEREGWFVTDDQIDGALAAVPAQTVPPASASRKIWNRTWGVLKGLATVDVPLFLLYGGIMTAAKIGYGAEGLHLFATEKFTSLMLMVLGLVVMRTIVAGTLATAKSGETLGQHWVSVAVPLRLTALSALLMPLVQGPAGEKISALSALWLSWLS